MPETVKTVRQSFATNDVVVDVETTTTVRPRIVDFKDILLACEVVPDELEIDVPWKDCDGYDHTVARINTAEGSQLDSLPAGQLEMVRGYTFSSRTRSRVVIQVDRDAHGIAAYRHARGCSKQVAAELAALDRRRTIDQIVRWYSEGWEYWGVTCEYYGEQASTWHIDNLEYAEGEVAREIAREVAGLLEKKGHLVLGQPDYRAEYRRNRFASMRLQLAACSWGDD